MSEENKYLNTNLELNSSSYILTLRLLEIQVHVFLFFKDKNLISRMTCCWQWYAKLNKTVIIVTVLLVKVIDKHMYSSIK